MNVSTAKAILIDIVMTGSHGLKYYKFAGKAYIDAGYLTGELEPIACVGTFREQVLLTAFTLTGCPVAARLVDDVVNPWRHTGGTYEANRILRTSLFSASSTISAVATDSQVSMALTVCVDGHLPSVVAIKEPFSERIDPTGCPGHLQGEFDLAFILEGQSRTLPASAVTEYRLPHPMRSAPTQRNITIDAIASGHKLRQVEQIDLYSDRTRAAIDLAARRHVESQVRCVSMHTQQYPHDEVR